eukprot:SAG31_NODE_1430_length_8385_cov_3.096186_2_plen_129_part_00
MRPIIKSQPSLSNLQLTVYQPLDRKLFGVLGYHSGVLCLLHSPADPKGIADNSDDALIKKVAKHGAQLIGDHMVAVPPYQLHGQGQRDTQYFGDPFGTTNFELIADDLRYADTVAAFNIHNCYTSCPV